ncbi:MAG: aminotransferase class V-fold PLP-dependent enzyme [Clostridia bacterium]|nr:aminotransferase class V-fold PLP-dependent enzyme [Clostridia bacterium]MDD4797996.1 aminotransferase class V-fold PLP-dependent enzyme [Clostridia bacterium]
MIYLDNSATSFPKPPQVIAAVNEYMTKVGININRGTYSLSYLAEDLVYETRELLADFFNYENPDNVIFTRSVTESLNTLLFGLLKDGDHVVVSSLEHNAVMRPLNALKSRGISFDRAACDNDGNLDLADFIIKIQKNTRAVVMTHASNVCGTVLDLAAVGAICRANNIFFIVDTAQSAGSIPIDMKSLQADALAFTAHKGLLAPQGLGGFIVNDRLNAELKPFIYGGTGSISHLEEQPEFMPDKFESGTMNLPAIYGLNAALKYIKTTSLQQIYAHENKLTGLLLDGLQEINGISVIGRHDLLWRTACVSLTVSGKDMGEVAHDIGNSAGIMVRCGIHCSPSAHKALGTYPDGTIRISIGSFNNKQDIKACLDYFNALMK